jgi:hypothetical protein
MGRGHGGGCGAGALPTVSAGPEGSTSGSPVAVPEREGSVGGAEESVLVAEGRAELSGAARSGPGDGDAVGACSQSSPLSGSPPPGHKETSSGSACQCLRGCTGAVERCGSAPPGWPSGPSGATGSLSGVVRWVRSARRSVDSALGTDPGRPTPTATAWPDGDCAHPAMQVTTTAAHQRHFTSTQTPGGRAGSAEPGARALRPANGEPHSPGLLSLSWTAAFRAPGWPQNISTAMLANGATITMSSTNDKPSSAPRLSP